jgi:hypothetical protein
VQPENIVVNAYAVDFQQSFDRAKNVKHGGGRSRDGLNTQTTHKQTRG